MAIITFPSEARAGEWLFTAADLAVLPRDLPSGTVDYELDDGRLVVMVPPGNIHGAVQSNIVTALKIQGEHAGLGKARSEVGIVLRRDPDRVVGADAAFIASASLPIQESPEGYLETMPDLVVEVRSKNDSSQYIDRKVADYLAADVRLVVVAEPQSKTVMVHRRGAPAQTFTEKDTLQLEDVIPGFRMPICDIFRE